MAAEGTSVSISETVLREIARQAHGTVDGLPMHIIRFVLEFPSEPDWQSQSTTHIHSWVG